MREKEDKPKRLLTALEDHSAEGIALLTAEPSRLIRSLIYIMAGLLLSALLWSFIGKADVIVNARGKLGPESGVRRVYTPVDGELVDIYMVEGMPVAKGDMLARINSPTAIEVATRAQDAQLKLTDALGRYKLFPARRKAWERRIAALKAQIDAEEKAHEKRVQESIAKLAKQQKLKLEKARTKFNKAKRAMENTKRILEKHERLFKSPGGGGISRDKVGEKRDEYQAKKIDYQLAQVALGEFEVGLNKEYAEKQEDVQRKSDNLENLYVQYEQEIVKLNQDLNRVETEVRLARISAEVAARVTFDDIDEDNFVRIKAPVSGVFTAVAFTQRGDKIEAKKPLAEIAPANARMVLDVEILEQDRGFLREGMPVKMKFSAFPYQRYGFINGVIEYIAPASTFDSETNKLVYKGRVSLERNHFSVGNAKFPLRYGMTASAEIVVRKRRLIEMAIDPFRRVAG